jgi:DNA-binding transcriptional regulator YiaG
VKKKRPQKFDNVSDMIRICVETGRYRNTIHVQERQKQRGILLVEILKVLRTGRHEKRKDSFDEENQTWKYAIRGNTVDGKAMGEWALDIDMNRFHTVVLLSLALHPFDLTGSQIRFIRLWLEMTQENFSTLFGVTQAAVVKWEKSKNKSAKISIATQREIRIYVVDQILRKDKDFRNAYRSILHLKLIQESEPLQLDASTDLMAI